jgi:uncharacterized protein YajQ (UPF0234 family)
MPSFDIVSEVDKQEIRNAVDQVNKEVANRFDFKGSDARVEQAEFVLTVFADDDFKLDQVQEVLNGKLVKRGIDIRCLDIAEKSEKVSGNKVKREVKVRNGIESEQAKKIVKLIKDSKLKVTASIQGESVRVSGAKRDILQECIALVKKSSRIFPSSSRTSGIDVPPDKTNTWIARRAPVKCAAFPDLPRHTGRHRHRGQIRHGDHSSRSRRLQEAPLLQHRGGRFPQSPRRPLHRAHRLLQPGGFRQPPKPCASTRVAWPTGKAWAPRLPTPWPGSCVAQQPPRPEDHVVMGRIVAPYAVKGWIKLQTFTEYLDSLLDYPVWRVGKDGNWRDCRLLDGKVHGEYLLASLEGVNDRDAAEALRAWTWRCCGRRCPRRTRTSITGTS